MAVSDIYWQLKNELAEKSVRLIAVSKKQDTPTIRNLYHAGQRDFGENYVQELIGKVPDLPADIQWHFIGHLQSNKVKYIVPFVASIQSIDSFDLLLEVEKQAVKHNRQIDVLLQLHVAEEETKFGLSEKELIRLLDQVDAQADNLTHIRICGLMAMGSFTSDSTQLEAEFKRAKTAFDYFRDTYFFRKPWFNRLSMGMSGDYALAIENGSTEVRIGSLLFGPRS